MKSFSLHQPKSTPEAVALFGAATDARFLAGGMTILPTMKMGLSTPSDVVDLSKIADLSFIRDQTDFLEMGAMTTHASVAKSAIVREKLPALAALAGAIGDPSVRNRGTLGGSVANNDPAADYPAAVLGLGATIVTDRRNISADEFFVGMFTTALMADELILSIRFPIPDKAGYAKFRAPASRYALVGVFVAQLGETVRVAVTGAGACVFRAAEFEQALTKRFDPMIPSQMAMSAEGLNSDIHADAEYRAHLIGVMTKRAVEAANIKRGG
jgi:carbon-monoxide dehydrogenase medium subunit